MNVQLRFSSVYDLWQFKETVHVQSVEVLTTEQVLLGDLDEAEIELAQRGYGAELVNTVQASQKIVV